MFAVVGNPLPLQAAADSIRHETLIADLQEAVPCAARSPYSMPLRSRPRCSGRISAQSLVQCGGVAEEAPLRNHRWQEEFHSRDCGSEECRAPAREDGEAGECWRWHRAMSSGALHNALKCGSKTRAAGATRQWFGNTDWNELGWNDAGYVKRHFQRPPAGPSNARTLRRSAMLRQPGS